MSEQKQPLLSVRDLKVDFGSRRKPFHAVKGVSFDIYPGETFGLVGESGSGKTTIGRAIIRIYETAGGEVVFKGQKINGKISKDLDGLIQGTAAGDGASGALGRGIAARVRQPLPA